MFADTINAVSSALIVIDVQNDFCKNGALAVPDAESAIPIINTLIAQAESIGMPIFYSRDWHPKSHSSFHNNAGPWPEHCVQDSWGAKFHASLYIAENSYLVNKAVTVELECYSALLGRIEGTNTVLYSLLQQREIKRILLCGFATDYCVFATAREALVKGLEVQLFLPGCRGINPITSNSCIETMLALGASIYKSA